MQRQFVPAAIKQAQESLTDALALKKNEYDTHYNQSIYQNLDSCCTFSDLIQLSTLLEVFMESPELEL